MSDQPEAAHTVNQRAPGSDRHVFVLATLDTKGREAAWVRDVLVSCGASAELVDVGCLGTPAVTPDVARDELFAAGGYDVRTLAAAGDRGRAVRAAADAAAAWIARADAAGRVAGVLALGGSAGTTIGATAMRSLPIGVPKLLASTLASGQVRHYVGDKDILMLNTVADLSGLNRLTHRVLGEAAPPWPAWCSLPIGPRAHELTMGRIALSWPRRCSA